MSLRLVSWNVNGIRSCVRKGFLDWLPTARAHVVALQETRCADADLPDELRDARGVAGFRHLTWSHARSRRGYSGVALLTKRAPEDVVTSLGVEEFDREGRFLLIQLEGLLVASVYFPKGSGNERDNSRVPYKLAFTERVFAVFDRERRRRKLPGVLLADVNIAPAPIDLARPKGNEKTSGFLPEERDLFARCLARGWIDAFRSLHPDEVKYSWWSSRFGVRAKNIGWRVDHALVSADLRPRLKQAFVWDQVAGSDHCPVGVDLAP